MLALSCPDWSIHAWTDYLDVYRLGLSDIPIHEQSDNLQYKLTYTGDLADRILSCRSNSVKKIDHIFFIFFEPTDRIFGVDKNEYQLRMM